MKPPCFQEHYRACELNEAKHNSNRIKNMGVLPLCGTSYHTLLIKFYYDETKNINIHNDNHPRLSRRSGQA